MTIDPEVEAQGRHSFFASPDRDNIFSETETEQSRKVANQTTYQQGFHKPK